MVEMIRIIKNCDNVGITAGHLDVFWREHRQAPEYKNIQVRREIDDRALIEYSLMGFYWSWDGTDQRSKWSAPPYARIRFQALPGSGQKVRLYVSPLEPSDRLMYPREPVLSEQGVVEFFQLLIAHLRNEGFEVQELQGPMPSEDSSAVAEQATLTEDEAGKMGIFFAYAREDETLRDELEKHLSMLKREGVITSWHDRKIGAGKEWKGQIDTHLNTAHVILLLISPDFIASDYCWDVEVKRAMERHEAGEARVIPVILRPVDWMSAPFGKLQALPTDAKPVTSWENRDEAFFDVAQGIRAAVVELRLIEMHDTRRGAYTLTEGIQREVSQRADYAGLDLNARQVKAMQYLEKHGKITSAIYCEEIAPRISRRMAHNDLEDLVKRGLVIRIGQTRRTRYVLHGSE